MIQLCEVLPPQPTPLWRLVKQIGVDGVVGGIPRGEGGEPGWALGPLRRMKAALEAAGFELRVIESSPPMDKLRLGLPGRDDELDWFRQFVRSLGELGVPVICYNWMAHIGWSRTVVDATGRGGALVSGFDLADFATEPTPHGNVSEQRLWDNLRWFLEHVLPTAEKAGVRLAMHPDDPPLSPLRGIGRIMSSVEGFQRLIDLVPSECNGITLCQGNFALMTDDLPAVIHQFGRQGAVHFVHLRDVVGTAERFFETFHDEGPTDLLACLRAYQQVGFAGPLRPDHVPTLEGDSNDNPCYSSTGRVFAVGYIKGLMEAVYGKAAVQGGG